jgi:hypothetical protein
MLPWDLEDWITEAGHAVIVRQASGSDDLSQLDNLLYQRWLLDTETRNGDLSQYFFNQGISQWQSCVSVSELAGLFAFDPFADAVQALISEASEPGEAIINAGDSAENLWYSYQESVVRQLKGLYLGAL